MDGWVDRWMDERWMVDAWMAVQKGGWMAVWMCSKLDEWTTDSSLDGCVHG